ncbi:hypothetical protein ACIRBX_26400 [Kitasatospora sp. NPDC096147]|uniref:hypothetical protein n=1 Tax=Kitasatospora sp. NPDC096147 TaxID=3364093 RepID=UPI0037FB0409
MPTTPNPSQPALEHFLCCVCGGSTAGAEDSVLLAVTSPKGPTEQWLGAHAEHLNDLLAPGFAVEVHRM